MGKAAGSESKGKEMKKKLSFSLSFVFLHLHLHLHLLPPSHFHLRPPAGHRRPGLGSQDDTDNQPVESQRLGENEDEDHAHKKFRLLRVCPDSGVADDADGHPGGEAGEAAGEARGEVGVAVEEVVGLVRGLVDCRECGGVGFFRKD